MGAFGSIIAGAGGAAGQYGQQMRGILEQRREHIAQLIGTHVLPELGEPYRSQAISAMAGIAGGEPMGKHMLALTETMQKHQADMDALKKAEANITQGIGPQPSTPKPTAVPTKVGEVAGTSTALPSTSPVQPESPNFASMKPGDVTQQTMGQSLAPFIATPQPGPTIERAGQTPQATAQPTPQPTQDPMDAVRARRVGIINKYNSMMQGASQHMRPILEAQMQGELQNLAPFEQQAMRMSNLQGLQGTQEYKDSPSYMKLSPVEQAYGFQPQQIGGMAGAIRPRPGPAADAATMERMYPGILARFGIDPTKTRNVIPYYSPMDQFSQQPPIGLEGAPTPLTEITNPDNTKSIVPKLPGNAGVTGNEAGVKTLPGVGGEVIQTSPAQVKGNIPPVKVPGAINAGTAPHTSVSYKSVQTKDENGNAVTRFEPVTSTRTVGDQPSGSSSSIPPKEFEKPFTPFQSLNNDTKLRTLTRAMDVMQGIRDKSHLLDSMLESGKLNVEMDTGGFLKWIVNRNLPMTKAESDFVGDFRTMMEDINLLRAPLQATGFRGPEAWAALQAQRGQILANPDITRRVIDNTLAAFRAVRDPLADRTGPKKPTTVPPVTVTPGTRKPLSEIFK